MADYAIGDVQGCYQPLLRLLDKINFSEISDRLWFVGDLVNRGPESLKVLRFIKNLPSSKITLGNHDLHLLVAIFCNELAKKSKDDTLDAILEADDKEELGHWLRNQAFLIHEPALNVVVCHAGIAPVWDLKLAKACALEVEQALAGEFFIDYLKNLYGNQPNYWSETLKGHERLRAITNYLTRMRFCNKQGALELESKGGLSSAPLDHIPWYLVPDRRAIEPDIVFGHWAALEGKRDLPKLYPIDTGCYWGGSLTALRLQDRVYFSVPGI